MFNQVVLMGRLTRDVELRYAQSGTAVSSFTLAVPRERDKEKTDFIDCVSFGKTAEAIAKYFTRGGLILISGSLQINQSTDGEGRKPKYTKIAVDKFRFTGENRGRTEAQQEPGEEMLGDDDLPF